MQHRSSAVAIARGSDAAALVVAHRGAWGAFGAPGAAQNSLEAFEHAITLGCAAIELDVRRSADERLVVIHEARVAGRPVAKLTHEQLQARGREGEPPLLEEVLELAAGRIAVDIELKADGYVDQAMAAVTRRLDPDQHVVTSFRDSVLAAVKRAAPDTRTGLLLTPRLQLGRLEGRLAATGADFLAPHARVARAGVLSWAAERGVPAWVWTVNERRALRLALADRRIAAVITDRPERALSLAATIR
jgi:glycerophosphoryl diester phosphodiesterase